LLERKNKDGIGFETQGSEISWQENDKKTSLTPVIVSVENF